jgi:hypothetical protein
MVNNLSDFIDKELLELLKTPLNELYLLAGDFHLHYFYHEMKEENNEKNFTIGIDEYYHLVQRY